MLNIGEKEIKIYKILLNNSARAIEIGKILGKDRSTIQRCLKKLVDCRMVKRKKKLIKGGGFYYIYTAVPIENLKKWLNKCIDKWYGEMKRAINELENIF